MHEVMHVSSVNYTRHTGHIKRWFFFNKAKVVEDKTTREGILDSTLRTTFKSCRWNQNPGMAVTVVKDGKQVFSKAYGHKDIESRGTSNQHNHVRNRVTDQSIRQPPCSKVYEQLF